MPKIPIRSATEDTRLNDVHGWGSQSFTVLGVSGYRLKPNSTVGDFRRETKSYDDLKKQLMEHEIDAKYVLPKFKAIWNGSGGTKRKREDPNPISEPSTEEVNMEIRQDPDQNFQLTPQPIPGEPVTNANPEIITSVEETPEVEAMMDNDQTPAIETGDVAAKVQVSVIPDQTLIVSGDDPSINAPTRMRPEDPIPTLPSISIGPAVSGVRMVQPLTHEELVMDRVSDDDLQQRKANFEKDIGGDGFGATPVNDDELPGEDGDLQPESASGSSKFTTVPVLGASKPPTFNTQQPVKPKDARTATMHPFKQASLFRNHDSVVDTAKRIRNAELDSIKVFEASASAVQNRGPSWMRYNAATQGVAMVDMPIESSNFLQRGEMISDYQLLGANPLQATFSPSPYMSNKLLGGFR